MIFSSCFFTCYNALNSLLITSYQILDYHQNIFVYLGALYKFLNVLQLQDITFICKKKGGKLNTISSHSEWCQTVQYEPDVISMSFIPITSLLTGVDGSGFLTHSINLYLRCTCKT